MDRLKKIMDKHKCILIRLIFVQLESANHHLMFFCEVLDPDNIPLEPRPWSLGFFCQEADPPDQLVEVPLVGPDPPACLGPQQLGGRVVAPRPGVEAGPGSGVDQGDLARAEAGVAPDLGGVGRLESRQDRSTRAVQGDHTGVPHVLDNKLVRLRGASVLRARNRGVRKINKATWG